MTRVHEPSPDLLDRAMPGGDAPAWRRPADPDRPGPRTDGPAATGCLLAAALAAMGLVLIIDTAERAWAWIDAKVARLFERPSGRVVGTFDGRHR